jgi:hypothetical protein
MINVKVKGIKVERKAFFFVVATDLKEAIDLAEEAVLRGTKTLKRLDSITGLDIVDDDVVISKKIINGKKNN